MPKLNIDVLNGSGDVRRHADLSENSITSPCARQGRKKMEITETWQKM